MSLYQPSHFTVGDRAALIALMHERPLATLVSVADGAPQFTHLPLEVEETAAGMRLLGHVARANPHWSQWSDGAAVTAVFRGPDGYVSPRCYAAREAVPTWNYIVVHAQGRIGITHDSAQKEHILKALIDRHDDAYRPQWDDLPESYREGMKRAIVGLTIEVERLDGKFKLGQNRPAQDRAAVRAAHAAAAPPVSLAEWMGRLGIGD
jgi:transcriptional regulator